MKTITLLPITGSFAENKDLAQNIRKTELVPELREGKEVSIDFAGVNATTQSFIHALLSEIIREFGSESIDRIVFKNCTETNKKIIRIVLDYMQEAENNS